MHSRQQLAVALSKLKVFENPDLRLEQYPTDSEVAATILWDAHMQGEIEGKLVADFGCGTGILGIGALLLGAAHVDFVELDERTLGTLGENLSTLDIEAGRYAILRQDIATYDGHVDVLLQNPPFGTQEKHADTHFLRQAIMTAPIVYSLHKASTIDYLRTWAAKNNRRIVHEYQFSFPLKASMAQHRKRIQRIDVVCVKIA